MRQRASTKTQRRLQQQLRRDPYALTDDVYSEAPTLRVGGLVTAAGALQLAAAVALGGLVFGGALLFCLLLLAGVGIALLRRQDAAGPKSLGLYQTFGRLLALRRGALDYSLTLSIAQSGHYQEKRDLQIAVVPTSPTPQKVVAAMSLSQPKAPVVQNRKLTPLAGDAPLVTLNHVQMKPLHTINSFSVEEEVHVEKPRSRSEPKQVLRSRPLLAPKPKVPEKKTTEMTASVAKAVAKAKAKAPEVQPKRQQKKQQVQAQPVAKTTPRQQPKKESKMPLALPKTEAKPVMPPVLAKAEPKLVQLKPTFTPVQTVAAPPAAVQAKPIVSEVAPAPAPVVPTLPVLFPERKSIVELARGEPAMERDLVVTRKVLLYLDPESEVVEMGSEEHELELEAEQQLERELEHAWAEEQEHAKEEIDFTMESFPPLSPPLAPMALPTPLDHHAEPNFLLDITLEPFSEPEKKIISFKALSPRKVRNADIRAMLDELDVMGLELDAAMAKCTRLLKGEEEKVSAPPSSELEPEEEPIFCC